LRPVSREALLALQKSYDVDLTYTSNAIEGNTLTLRETAELIEHGITVGGNRCAIILRPWTITTPFCGCASWRKRARLLTRHREVHPVLLPQPTEIGGIYSTLPRRIAGSPVVFPNAAKIPQLMVNSGDG